MKLLYNKDKGLKAPSKRLTKKFMRKVDWGTTEVDPKIEESPLEANIQKEEIPEETVTYTSGSYRPNHLGNERFRSDRFESDNYEKPKYRYYNNKSYKAPKRSIMKGYSVDNEPHIPTESGWELKTKTGATVRDAGLDISNGMSKQDMKRVIRVNRQQGINKFWGKIFGNKKKKDIMSFKYGGSLLYTPKQK